MKVSNYIFAFIVMLFLNWADRVYGQKKDFFTIEFIGPSFDTTNLRINFYNGYNVQAIPRKSSSNIIESKLSTFKFPVLEFFYFSSKHKPTIQRFFLTKQTSFIRVNYDLVKDDLSIKESHGFINFKDAGQKKFGEFAKKQLLDLEVFEKKYNYDYNNADSATLNQLTNLTLALRDKGIDFIRANPKSLYSLWFFMNEIIGKPNYSFEYLDTIYSKFLRPNFKFTFENQYILDKLNKNRLAINANAPFQNVEFTDIYNNQHKIKDFSGKPVIIMLWATWCVPCVAEIPKLKKIYSEYKGRLEFISFSTDTNKKIHENFVTKNDLNWINVFGRKDFCNIYGRDSGIPQVYLLDKNGVIIYSRTIFKDEELNKLSTILEEFFAR